MCTTCTSYAPAVQFPNTSFELVLFCPLFVFEGVQDRQNIPPVMIETENTPPECLTTLMDKDRFADERLLWTLIGVTVHIIEGKQHRCQQRTHARSSVGCVIFIYFPQTPRPAIAGEAFLRQSQILICVRLAVRVLRSGLQC